MLIADHRIFESLLTEMEKSADNEYLHRTQLFLRLKRRLAAHAMAEEDCGLSVASRQGQGGRRRKAPLRQQPPI